MSKRPRKKHRPKAELFDPLSAMRPLPAEKIQRDMDRNFSALAAMETGVHATDQEWIDLSDCVNTVEMLIEQNEIDSTHIPTSQRAIEAMVAAKNRHVAGFKLRMSAQEMEDMRDLLTLYHACLERKPWMIIYKAQKACQDRINRQINSTPARTGRAKS